VFLHPELSDTTDPANPVYVFVIEDGHRRFRALSELGFLILFEIKEVAAELDTYDKIVNDRLGKLVAYNDGVRFTRMEEAKIYQEFRLAGNSVQEIATIVGKSRQHVDTMLKLNDLPEETQQAIAEGKISPTMAADIQQASNSPEEAAKTIEEAIENATSQGATVVGTSHVPAGIVDKKVSFGRLTVFRDHFAGNAGDPNSGTPELYAILNACAMYVENKLLLAEAMQQVFAVFPDAKTTIPQTLLDKIASEEEAARKKEQDKVDKAAAKVAEAAKKVADKEAEKAAKELEKTTKLAAKEAAKKVKEVEAAEKANAKLAKEQAAFANSIPQEAATGGGGLAAVAPHSKEAMFGKPKGGKKGAAGIVLGNGIEAAN